MLAVVACAGTKDTSATQAQVYVPLFRQQELRFAMQT